MVEVKVVKNIEVSVASAWELFGNFGDLSWIGVDQKVEVIGEGIGMTRRLHIPGIDPIDEILLSMDDEQRWLTYKIPKNTVVPFDKYEAKVSVTGDEQASTVEWTSTFEEGEMNPGQARDLIAGNYSMMLDAAADKLTA